MLIAFSRFARITSTAPDLRSGWDELCDLLTAPAVELRASSTSDVATVKRAKESAPCWSPCVFRGPRGKATAVAVTCAVLDLDGVTLDVFGAALRAVPGAAVVHSTARHAPQVDGLVRARIVMPLSRPVAAAEWGAVWRALRARWPMTDKADSDASRAYFVPSRLSDCHSFVRVYEGEPLDVEELLASTTPKAAPAPVVPPPAAGRAMTRDDLEVLARKYRRSSDLERASVGRAMGAIARGEAWGQPGEQDTTIFSVFRAIVRDIPWASDKSILDVCEPSRALMAQHAGDWSDLADKLDRIRAHAERAAVTPAEGAAYSAEQIASLTAFCGGSLAHRWILQLNGAWYILTHGDRGPHYAGPFAQPDRMLNAGELLAPAISAGVQLLKPPDARGVVRAKSADELAAEYGTGLQGITTSLVESATRYDARTRTVIEAPTPLRALTPAYDPEVDEWLRLLCGGQYEKVNQWLSAVTELDKPCVALMFTGQRGTGKTLFAESVSRLWTESMAVQWASVMGGSFNDALTSCPLVFADEYVPLERGTEHLRGFITAHQRALARKFLPSSTLLGCVRMVIASNDDDALRVGGDLSDHTLGALAERILVVEVPGSAARTYTDNLPDKGNSFRYGDRVARHALWLRDNLQWQRHGRHMIATQSEALIAKQANESGTRGDVLQVVMHALRNKLAGAEPAVIARDGEILVHTGRVIESWANVFGSEKCPRGKVRAAMKALAVDGRERRPIAGSRSRYVAIKLDALRETAEAHGYDRAIVADWLDGGAVIVAPSARAN